MNTREVSEKLQDWQKRASETVRNAGQATNEYVHENTWTSIALGAVIGCLIGFLLARRNS